MEKHKIFDCNSIFTTPNAQQELRHVFHAQPFICECHFVYLWSVVNIILKKLGKPSKYKSMSKVNALALSSSIIALIFLSR